MNKKLNIKPIVILIIAIGFLILIKTQFPLYRVSNSAMEPIFRSGEIILVNKMGNIAHNSKCIFSIKGEEYFSRIVGASGQKVEIVDGMLWVDNVHHDEINTQLAYKVILGNHPALAENDLLLKLEQLNDYDEYKAYLTTLEYQKIKQLAYVKKIDAIVHPKGYYYSFSDNPIYPNKKNIDWSIDNFGPLTVPEDCFFVLGDNRHQAIDSRYFGFVKKEDIVGTVMFKLSLED